MRPWGWVEQRADQFHAAQAVRHDVMEDDQDTHMAVGQPGNDVHPPQRMGPVQRDHGSLRAPVQEGRLVGQRPLGGREDDMASDVEGCCIDPERTAFADMCAVQHPAQRRGPMQVRLHRGPHRSEHRRCVAGIGPTRRQPVQDADERDVHRRRGGLRPQGAQVRHGHPGDAPRRAHGLPLETCPPSTKALTARRSRSQVRCIHQPSSGVATRSGPRG